MIQQETKTRIYRIAALCIMAVLLIFPVKSLIADRYYHRVASLLANDVDQGRTRLPISGETMPRYIEAAHSLETACALVPSRSSYQKALSELSMRLGVWASTMESMKEALPPGALSSKEAFEKTRVALNTAISLEPTNPDCHFALGVLYDLTEKNTGLSEKELARAISAYPVNASLRYAVALQHLNAGRRGDALEHATALAKAEGESFSYLSPSWLFKSFEIGWRATNDLQVVQGLSPDAPEALEVLEKYLKWKGLGNSEK